LRHDALLVSAGSFVNVSGLLKTFTLVSRSKRLGIYWNGIVFKKHFNNAIFVGGNHIVYNHDYKPIHELHREYRTEFPLASSVSYLENDYKEIDDVVFIGATLWTDYNYRGSTMENMKYAAVGMNDFNYGCFEENGESVQK